MTTPSSDRFSLLFLCTGNICRSPMAERLAVRHLHDGAAGIVEVASAGTRALVGHPMDALAAEVLRGLGGDPDGHEGRQVDMAAVASVDLILTASAEHRDRILRERPAVMRRIFTMKEFARLAAGVESSAGTGLGAATGTVTADELRDRVRVVASQRGLAEPVEPVEDEIGDPYGSTREVMVACGAQVAAAVDGMAAALGLAAD